jgi:hypothetical protein
LEAFEELCKTIPTEVKRTGIICAKDILDGEGYFVKWVCDHETTRLYLGNPRLIDDDVMRQVADRLDDLMLKCSGRGWFHSLVKRFRYSGGRI